MKRIRNTPLILGSGFLSIGLLAGPSAFQSHPFGAVEALGSAVAGEPARPSQIPTEPPTEVAPLPEDVPSGAATLDPAAPSAATPPTHHVHTQEGAASAFASLATWVVLSNVSRSDPHAAVEQLGNDVLNPADAQLLTSMSRSSDDEFRVGEGAYRVLGYSGPADNPDQVMIEVTAPLRLAGTERWAVVGGVVSWQGGEWVLTSIAPREVEGTDPQQAPVGDASDIAGGQGWVTFDTASSN